jgi:hypothetical protein
MNERIKELADEARLITVNGQTRYALAEEFEQRFAMLIVQECADLFTRTHTDEQYQRRIDKTILKHFGVEE